MKNISLQTLQVPSATNSSVKNMAEQAARSDAGVSNQDLGAVSSPFQLELSKHVDKSAQVKQGSSAQQGTTDSVKHVLKNQVTAKQNHADQVAVNRKNLVKSQAADGNGEDGLAALLASSKELDDNQLLKIESETLTSTELTAKDAEQIPEIPENLLGFLMPASTPAINVNPQLVMQIAATANGGVDTAQDNLGSDAEYSNKFGGKFTSSSKIDGSLKPSYDEALNNALISSKNVNVPESLVKTKQDVPNGMDNSPDKTNASEHARWLDAVLPSASKQNVLANETDVLVNKASINAAQIAIESSIKGQAQPHGIQVAAQVSPAFSSIQQAGSVNTISSYPGKSGWDQAISQKVVWMVGAGEQSATLTLNPPDLGPLQVVIRVHNDQADTTFISNNAEVRQALENGLSNLREKMSESGIQLGQTNVSADNQSQQEFQRATQNRPEISTNSNDDVQSQLGFDAGNAPARYINGLVDIFA